MSASTRRTIGFDRTIELIWLDIAAGQLERGKPASEIREALWQFLEDLVPGNTNGSGRGKTLTVVTRIWLAIPEEVLPLREDALKCLATVNGDQRVAIHWAMLIATHPFFFDVASNVGKLLAMHGEVNGSQIKRRMTVAWGERSTLERTIQHVLRSIVQWGLLRHGSEKGSLIASPVVDVTDELADLLVQSVRLSRGPGIGVSQLENNPALFPFNVQFSAGRVKRDERIVVQRQGGHNDLLSRA